MVASNAIDNNPSTRWGACVNGCEAESWLHVNLGGIFSLREILIEWEYAHAADFYVRVSNDEITWHTVYQEYGKSSEADTRIDVSNIPSAQSAKWVQIVMTRRREGMTGFSIFSMNCYKQYVVISSYGPENVVDGLTSTRWSSTILGSGTDPEWLEVDMGGPQLLKSVTINWEYRAYAVAFQIQVSNDRSTWVDIHAESGKSSDAPTSVDVANVVAAQGSRYLRVYCTQTRSMYNNFSINYLRIYRKPMVIGENPTGLACGATIEAARDRLLGTYGGTHIHTYINAEFFSASFASASQQAAMLDDNCVFTVEPSYIVRARGTTTNHLRASGNEGGDPQEEQQGRRLAIPEFNLKETPRSKLNLVVF